MGKNRTGVVYYGRRDSTLQKDLELWHPPTTAPCTYSTDDRIYGYPKTSESIMYRYDEVHRDPCIVGNVVDLLHVIHLDGDRLRRELRYAKDWVAAGATLASFWVFCTFIVIFKHFNRRGGYEEHPTGVELSPALGTPE